MLRKLKALNLLKDKVAHMLHDCDLSCQYEVRTIFLKIIVILLLPNN